MQIHKLYNDISQITSELEPTPCLIQNGNVPSMALVGHDGIPKVLVRLDRIQEKGIDSGIGEARLQLSGENLQDKGLVVRESKAGRSGFPPK